MVLGTENAMQMIEGRENTECYLIYATETGTDVKMTKGMEELIAGK